MSHRPRISAAALLGALCLTGAATPSAAQTPPPFTSTRIEGTDSVYLFRYGNHQSIFVVTPEGVIVTDPIGFNRPAAQAYIAEIRKVTQAPIKYVIYSHLHFDHSTGGQPFKDLGARFVGHRNMDVALKRLQNPDIVPLDQVVDDRATLSLGGTNVDLIYLGRNHSDSSLVVSLPKDKLAFTVDWAPVGAAPSAATFGNSYPMEYQASLRKLAALDWERLVPGHPAADGRLGTRQDMVAMADYLDEVAAKTKAASAVNNCSVDGRKTITLTPRAWVSADAAAAAITRYCTYWTQGY